MKQWRNKTDSEIGNTRMEIWSYTSWLLKTDSEIGNTRTEIWSYTSWLLDIWRLIIKVKGSLGTFFVAAIKEYNELYRNMNKITDVVNNSLITTMTASEVIKTDCYTCVSLALTLKNSELCSQNLCVSSDSHKIQPELPQQH